MKRAAASWSRTDHPDPKLERYDLSPIKSTSIFIAGDRKKKQL